MILKVLKRKLCSKSLLPAITDKCKGCLIGSLVGDCYAKPFRLSDEVSKSQLQSYFDKLDGTYFKAPFKPYSANIALSLCTGESLASLGKFSAEDITQKFIRVFYHEPNRDYGSNISKICIKLRASKCSDPYKPASEQYNGAGSCGNSAAARVSPIVIFYLDDAQRMTDTTLKSTQITHTNNMACYGALLQAWAIRLALDADSNLCYKTYLEQLISKVEHFTVDELDRDDALKFAKQLDIVGKLLDMGNATEYDVVNLLGHGKIALYSVPTAIYCFLRGLSAIPDIDTSNAFRRTVQYAILLGGDTIYIGGMAGALAGALYGQSAISKLLLMHCENYEGVEVASDRLLKCCRGIQGPLARKIVT